MPKHDLVTFYRNQLLFYPHLLPEDKKTQYLLKPGTSEFTDEAEFAIIQIKVERNIADQNEKDRWSQLLKVRSDARMDGIKKHLGISDKAVRDLILNDFKRYVTLLQSTWMFETETLAYLGPRACIYWDFERFIHIFLRHNPDFFVAASTKGAGTPFQYKFQDIERVVKIVLGQLRNEITNRLSSGLLFSINGHYYNGNHYQIRIDPDGQLMQFHPQD